MTIDADKIKDNELTTRQSTIAMNKRIAGHATYCFDDTGRFADTKK